MALDAFKPYLKALQTKLRAPGASERTHYGNLEGLLKALDGRLTVIAEPAGIPGASVDFLLRRGQRTVGHIEAKDVGRSLDEAEASEQLQRYLQRFPNLMLTDFLEFRWYTDGKRRAEARLARSDSAGKITPAEGGPEAVLAVLRDFLAHAPPEIGRPIPLAKRLARLTQELHDLVIATFRAEAAGDQLHGQFEAFKETLIHDLTPEQFADMYAQTVTYGLFAARAQNSTDPEFTRQKAVFDLPRTNPFLRKLFGQIAGPDLDRSIAWLVDELADVMDQADFSEILKDFGRRTKKEDPVVHFYETLLAEYNRHIREMRGVYYTPEPVVSYIVRSVDHLLRERFDKRRGLADDGVFILDPACGTGTFLYFVIRLIHESLMERGQAGGFNAYAETHLLPRLFGFELLMAPYAVSHMKLGIELKDLGYEFESDERLGVYLTNTLEEAVKQSEHLLAGWIAEEANAAAEIKRDKPIMVVLGNPPYSGHSANASWEYVQVKGKKKKRQTWIGRQLEPYYKLDGKPLGEKNPKWLQDDYVKFIRFGQWRIERTGHGILAFVTNHAYLDNPTFRGMRQSLMKSFDDIYIVDLHGNARKGEVCPDGSSDANVFDIQQGVAIGIFVKDGSRHGRPAAVHHADLWGPRESKQAALFEQELPTTAWTHLDPEGPYYLFVPWDTSRWAEYEEGWKVTDAFPVNSVGIVTSRDAFVLDFHRQDLERRIAAFADCPTEEARRGWELRDKQGWTVADAQEAVRTDAHWREALIRCLYRPFDSRWLCYHEAVVERSRREVMRHMLNRKNLAMHTCRQLATTGWHHLLATNAVTDDCYVSNKSKERGYLLSLYLYPKDEDEPGTQREIETAPWPAGPDGRRPNLDPAFVEAFAERLGMTFVPDGTGDRETTFGPQDVFHYAYAVFHCPTYRERYAEFLKIDFPRLPLTSDADLFRTLCGLGAELVALHLLESPKVEESMTAYPVEGHNLVAKGYPKYLTPEEAERRSHSERPAGVEESRREEPQNERPRRDPSTSVGVTAPGGAGRVYINKKQYFQGVPPEVWEFHVGGYPVAEKWLRDRRGRKLTWDDISHYQQVIVALAETIRLMAAVDEAIPSWPID